MSELKLKDQVLIAQRAIEPNKNRNRDGKLITYAPDFILRNVPSELLSLVNSLNVNNIVFNPDGTCYLARYLKTTERQALRNFLSDEDESTTPLPTDICSDSIVCIASNILSMNSVPLFRVSQEGFIFMANILNRFFVQLEDLIRAGKIAEFDLKVLMEKLPYGYDTRDSIFTTIVHLAHTFCCANRLILKGYDAKNHKLTTLVAWHDVPNFDKSAVPTSIRSKAQDDPTEEKKLVKTIKLDVKGLISLHLRCLAIIAVTEGRPLIDNNLDSIGF